MRAPAPTMTATAARPWLTGARLEFWALALLVFYLSGTVIWTWQAADNGMIDPRERPVGCDFIEFWAAAKAALGHMAAGVYDYHALYPIERTAVAAVSARFPFHYPPILLLLLLPFALLPYLWAVPLWYAGGVASYLSLARRLAADRRAFWIGLAFPGVLLTITYGQMGFWLTAALGWALLLLDKRPVAAGALLGLLAVKPHLFLLLPLALLASRRWSALATAAFVALLLVIASWLAFGTETWQAFLANLEALRHGDIKEASSNLLETYQAWLIPWNKVPSVFVMMRLFGADMSIARAAQGLVAFDAALVVVWVWRSGAALELKAAALVAANLLVSPYLFDYDLILLILPIAWLAARALAQGWLPGEKIMIFALWLSPGLVSFVAVLLHLQLAPLLLAGFLGLICRRMVRERRAAMTSPSATIFVPSAAHAREGDLDCA
jgi:hypothetical protein